MMKKYLPFAALAVLGLTSVASAARNDGRAKAGRGADDCAVRTQNDYDRKACCPAPEGPAPCYPDDCVECVRCLGPMNFSGNPPVCPRTCDGDYIFTASALYWTSHQDGMEFAIDSGVTSPTVTPGVAPTNANLIQLNQLADASYKNPHSKWEWGFKLGLGYCNACDGWDLALNWTWYHGKSNSDVDSDVEDNRTLIPLWSEFNPSFGPGQGAPAGAAATFLYATQASADWKLKLNLVDLELGRNYWVSHYLSIRPFVGVRYASIKQHSEFAYNGGAFSNFTITTFDQPAVNDFVDIKNDYRGAGLRGGLNSDWHLGCGWAIYGKSAFSIVYGRFHVDHDEFIRQSLTPHNIVSILDTSESFRAARAIVDLELGVEWSTMFCDCKYNFTAQLGWEQHMFFDQNQMWRVNRVGGTNTTIPTTLSTLNTSGQNVFEQRRGTLDTSGLTLTAKFEF